MKRKINQTIIHLFRYFVGTLFIFSGLIKLNDPVGFSFKLEEYFGPTVFDLDFLIPIVLPMAIFIVIFEVILGIFLILGFKKEFTLWSLLLMIIFFTFLTWYSAYFNKVTDCGCFGDAIKLTPWESFTKDVILLVMIAFLFIKKDLINPILNLNIQKIVIGTSLLVCFCITYYVLNHLPIRDFRAYKIGSNIIDSRKTCNELGLPCDETTQLMLVKDISSGNTTQIYMEDYIKDYKKYQFIKNIGDPIILKEGYNPKIFDFSIEVNGNDVTNEILSEEKLVIYISYDLDKFSQDAILNLQKSAKKAKNKGFKIIGLTASSEEERNIFIKNNNLFFEFYVCDETALKTIVRSNPGAIVLRSGTVVDKKHFKDFSDLNL